MIPIKIRRMALPFSRNALPMLGEAGAQVARQGEPSGFAYCNGDIDGR
jgi:hypothetical protein